jgi:hypothetical protein
MTSVEQHKIVAELCDHEGRMSRQDLEVFAMFRKRDHDDEDLDLQSKRKLMELHDRYAKKTRPEGNPLDALFKK